MDEEKAIKAASAHFEQVLREQLHRIEELKKPNEWIDYTKLEPLIIGYVGGDGIGVQITDNARKVLEFMLRDEIASGKVLMKKIDGLTIENRAKVKKAIPDDVLVEIKKCHVILKGPTTTPKTGDPWPNIESANVAMRRELDLFANVRPTKNASKNIDWLIFRENTEGAYAAGSLGVSPTADLSVDFKIVTTQGSERILRMAFEYARTNNINSVTVVTKANVVKATDGKFLAVAREVAKDYPEVQWEDWFVDIMAAKLLDPTRQQQFRVIVCPNLYGDILSDEAGQIQGGVGTAGSANIGTRYAMFEAIHGSAPRMVEEGRSQYADPSSLIISSVMLLRHVGYGEYADKLEKAISICGMWERKVKVTGYANTGATGSEFCNYIMKTMQDPNLEEKFEALKAAQYLPSSYVT